MIKDTAGRIETEYKVVIEKEYDHPLAKVWKALTEAEHVSSWMEFKASIDLRRGGKFFVDFQPRDEPLDGIITTLIPEQKLYYSWGRNMVQWEVEEEGGKVKLRFEHNGLDKNMAIGLGSGWEAFIDYLGPHLDGTPFPPNRHESLMGEYEKMV